MCELLHTSNHRYFDGNNNGSLLSAPRVAAQTCASRPDPPAGPPIDGSGLATSAQEEKRGASWPTGQRHTCSPGSVRRIAISLWQRCVPTRHGHATGRDLPRPLPWIMTKTILAEAATPRSAVQTKSPSWDSSEAHGEAGVISYRANIIALP